MLGDDFFDRDARVVARALLGCVLRRRWRGQWLAARVIETEAYRRAEKGSHASLGRTPSREALFMPPGTLYMYYSRAGDSLNVSCRGEGDAVLFKSGHPYLDDRSGPEALALMHSLNPARDGSQRKPERLCAGQTLLCRSLALKVPDWTGRRFGEAFYAEDVGDAPPVALQAPRLGIPTGRDEHLPYRYVDERYARWCTSDPRRKRAWREGLEWRRLVAGASDPALDP